MIRIAFVLLMGSSFAFAQLDSLALRAKLGSPLHRETFHAAAGFDIIVDYSLGGRVCKLEVPALMPTSDNPKNADVMRQRMRDFLAEIVPTAMRGTRGMMMSQVTGLISMTSTEYENVTIREARTGSDPFTSGDTIVVTFKNEPCDR